MSGAEALQGFLVYTSFVCGYLLPSVVAGWRRHHNTAAIAALNLLLGWTVLGWIGALVWSLTEVRGDQGAVEAKPRR